MPEDPPLIVLDTMVIVAAIIGQPEGSSATALHAVATGDVQLAISDDFLSEVVRVMSYSHIEQQIYHPVRAFQAALDLGTMGFMFHPRRLDWPSLYDPADGWVLDLAYEASANYIITIDSHLREAATSLGFETLTPADLLAVLRRA